MFRLDEVRKTFEELESLLRDAGVKVGPGSGLERAFLAVANWEYQAQSPSGTTEDARRDTRDVVGAVNVASNILSVRHHPSFGEVIDHLALLATADPSTQPMARFSAVDCQLYELLVACWSMRAKAHVGLEPSLGATEEPNPDIVATIEGFSIGIACKAPDSNALESYCKRMKEGAFQTLRRASDVGRLVVVNARTRIPFDEFQPTLGRFGSKIDPPRYGVFEDRDEPERILARHMERLNAELADLHNRDVNHDPHSPMSKIDGWLFSAHAPTTIIADALRSVDGALSRSVGPVQASAKYAGNAKLYSANPRVHEFLDALAVEANRNLIGTGDGVSLE
jgi:hypothetical protein